MKHPRGDGREILSCPGLTNIYTKFIARAFLRPRKTHSKGEPSDKGKPWPKSWQTMRGQGQLKKNQFKIKTHLPFSPHQYNETKADTRAMEMGNV